MKQFLLLTIALFTLSTASFSQIRIEKRRYTKGWYVDLNHSKKKTARTENAAFSPAVEKTFADTLAVAVENSVVVDPAKTVFPETSPVVTEHSVAPVKKTIDVAKNIHAPLVKPVKKIAHSAPVKKVISFPQKQHNTRSLQGDNDMWEPFFKGLLWLLIGLLVCALLWALIEIVLLSLFPEATAELIEWAIIIGFFVIYGIVWGAIQLVKMIAEHYRYKHAE